MLGMGQVIVILLSSLIFRLGGHGKTVMVDGIFGMARLLLRAHLSIPLK